MNKQIQKSFINVRALCMIAVFLFFWSCESNESEKKGIEYKEGVPVEIYDFEPEGGGLATKVFITGSNFGTDLSQIEVYFGDTPATVVNSTGEYLYVYSPRQEDGIRDIRVVSHGKDAISKTDKKFKYAVNYVVRTFTGRKGTTEFKPGTLATAEFQYPSTVTADMDGNVFVAHWRVPYNLIRINEEEDVVEAIIEGSNDAYWAMGAPTVDSEGVVSAISDGGGVYFTCNPIEGWQLRVRNIDPDPLSPYARSTAHALAAHPVTGNLYTRYYTSGDIVVVDKETRLGRLEAKSITTSDSYLVFDPKNPNLLYIAYDGAECIGVYNLETKEHSIFAGMERVGGWQDGSLTDARFSRPSQLIVAPNGNLYVADRGNHCIREIILPTEDNPNGMVRTIIGKPGVAGYQDGNPDDALFNEPRGVAVLPDGTIYISEWGNNVVRKISRE